MAAKLLPQSGIYSIRNVVSGRVYVGSAVNIVARWAVHRSLLADGKHHSRAFQRSWDKHGVVAFEFSVLEFVEDRSQLLVREQVWIDQLFAACPKRGLNCRHRAESNFGMTYSASHRAKIAAARRGTIASAETRAKMSATRKGVPRGPRSASHCAAISAAKKGKPAPHTAEANRRRRGTKKPPMPQETRAKISLAKMGKKRSLKSRLKQSKTMKLTNAADRLNGHRLNPLDKDYNSHQR